MAGQTPIEIYLEIGTKRTFAGSPHWPGWARSGKDEEAAVEALLAYGPRYALALRGSRLGFRTPGPSDAIRVVERLPGDATTDFGAPSAATSQDAEPMTEADLTRSRSLLRTCWRAFDRAADAAEGVELRKGPRGGGRDLRAIVGHVVGAEASYLSMIGTRLRLGDDPAAELQRAREAVLEGLASAVRDGIPPSPRGGKRWTPPYFVRRSAWHVLDHAWEIEDRSER